MLIPRLIFLTTLTTLLITLLSTNSVQHVSAKNNIDSLIDKPIDQSDSDKYEKAIPTSCLQYENSTYGIKMQYRANWTIENAQSNASDDTVTIAYIYPPISSDPNATAEIEIGYESFTQGENLTLEEYVRDVVQTNIDETSKFKVVNVNTNTPLAGRPGYSLVSTDTEDGTDMKSIEVGTIVDGKVYYVVFSAEESRYNYFLPDVQKMIDSFEIADSKGEVNKQVKVDNANAC